MIDSSSALSKDWEVLVAGEGFALFRGVCGVRGGLLVICSPLLDSMILFGR